MKAMARALGQVSSLLDVEEQNTLPTAVWLAPMPGTVDAPATEVGSSESPPAGTQETRRERPPGERAPPIAKSHRPRRIVIAAIVAVAAIIGAITTWTIVATSRASR